MARVTVEDCVVKVPNRFELVMLAARRARAVSAGAALTVERDNDKNPVIALREIAKGSVELKDLEESLIKDEQKHVEFDQPEEEEIDLSAIQQEMSGELAKAAAEAKPEPMLEDEEGDGTELEAEAEIEAEVANSDLAPDADPAIPVEDKQEK